MVNPTMPWKRVSKEWPTSLGMQSKKRVTREVDREAIVDKRASAETPPKALRARTFRLGKQFIKFKSIESLMPAAP